MLTDFYGNHLTTSTGLARDSYDIGLRAFLSANYGAQEAFSQSIEADPNFVLAYLGLTRAFMSSGQAPEAKVALGKAKNLLDRVTDREKSHFLCCELILLGEAKKARAAVQNHVSEWPRDAMVAQMNTSVFGLIGFSGEVGREVELLKYTERLLPHYGEDWWMASMHAISLCETGQTLKSMQLMEKALNLNPRNANAAHFFAHILYEENEVSAGRDYLAAWMPNYDRRSLLHGHLSWHQALWALNEGDDNAMWDIVDASVSQEKGSSLPINALTDTASIYYRAELAGYNVSAERWLKLSEYAAEKFPKMGQSFADMHAALAHAMAGNNDYLSKLIDGNSGFAGDIVPAVAKAWKAISESNWNKAREELETAASEFERFGGSRAQRDLLEFTYVNVLLRNGSKKAARKALLDRRPVFYETAPIKGLSSL
ncbi:tetratricopeptide repeat protein [Paracoccaceae bacterium]|nr:tetratricopeptide repeat protein [Paracoccaceae bacterium]